MRASIAANLTYFCKHLFWFAPILCYCLRGIVNRELTNRRLWLDDVVGFRDMPTAHANKRSYWRRVKVDDFSVCWRLKRAGRDASCRCILLINRVFLEKLLKGEQTVIVSWKQMVPAIVNHFHKVVCSDGNLRSLHCKIKKTETPYLQG